mgnify:CR=1 FL=1
MLCTASILPWVVSWSLSAAVSTAQAASSVQPVLVGVPEVLPLALDDTFRVVKVSAQTVDPEKNRKILLPALKAEVDRRYFGAINAFERRQREGCYYTIEWQAPKKGFSWFSKSSAPAEPIPAVNATATASSKKKLAVSSPDEVTIRLEYRQQKLGNHVQALDVRYPSPSGTIHTEFSVLGDDYYQDGPVVAWRVLLIRAGRIVGVQQSFLW